MWGANVVVLQGTYGSAHGSQARTDDGAALLPFDPLSLNKTLVVSDSVELLKAELARSTGSCDVFITDLHPKELEELSIDLDGLAQGPVVLHITPFGTSGPYAGREATELTIQALSGFMALNGVPGREPVKAASSLVSQAVGVNAFIGGMAALRERELSGRGQVVEVAEFEAAASLVPLLRSEYSGVNDQRQGGPISGTIMFECNDGFISLNPFGSRNWQDLCLVLGLNASELSAENMEAEAVHMVAAKTRGFPARELFQRLNELRVPCGIAQGPTALLEDDQLRSRSFFFSVDAAEGDNVPVPGPPARMSRTPMTRPRLPNTLVGESPTRGLSRQPRPVSPAPNLPLDGVRILDLTSAWLGPYASMLLADLGADIVKIEAPHRPDGWRGAAMQRVPSSDGRPPIWASYPTNPDAHPWNSNANFNSVNRNKQSLALDLTTEEGKEIVLRLAVESDILLENFTPRVMKNFGLTYEVLERVNPTLVMVSFSGYGQTGPYKDFRANGATTDTTCGWASLTGYPGGPPTMMGAMEADPITGLQMAATALVAFAHARKTGEGQHVEGSMLETCVGYLSQELALASRTHQDPPRMGNRSATMAPHGVYACRGEDQWVSIAVRDDDDWARLLTIATVPDTLRDATFSHRTARLARADELDSHIQAWTQSQTAEDVMDVLLEVGVPAGVVQNYIAVLHDKQLSARDWFQPIAHPDMGSHRYNGFPWRFSRTPATVRKAPPRLGEDSDDLLRKKLGFNDMEVAQMIASGVTRYVESRDSA